MVDGTVEGEDGDEDDTLHTPSGSRKRSPYLARQSCRGKPRPPMGPGCPLLVRQGYVVLHKEQTSMGQHNRYYTGNFTQVGAAVRRKTLLLHWWIDGGLRWRTRHSCQVGLPRGESGYARINVQGSESSLRLPWASFCRSKGHHSGKSVFYIPIR